MFNSDAPTGKLTIRNLPARILDALSKLAEQRDRSTEAEARQALRAWVQPQIEGAERASRAVAVGQRLQYLQSELARLRTSPKATPSRIAEALGWSHAEKVERWFAGEAEPSFAELTQIADLLGCQTDWLLHGEGEPYSAIYTRIPEDAFAGPEWLLTPSASGKKPRIYLIRCRSKAGEFAFVKSFSDWNAQVFTTPYHVSDEIGAGGESSLAWLSLVLEGLYKRWTGIEGSEIQIGGYLVSKESFSSLLAGKRHPVSILQEEEKSHWWEDFWDENQFRNSEYWPGWKAITERIYRVVEARQSMREQREKLKTYRGSIELLTDQQD
jgi:plasmid stability protein